MYFVKSLKNVIPDENQLSVYLNAYILNLFPKR